MAWFYKDGLEEIGPVSKADLQQLIKAKKVGAKTMVRNEESDQWRPLVELVRGQPKAQQAAGAPAPPAVEPLPAMPEEEATADTIPPLTMDTRQSEAAGRTEEPKNGAQGPATAVCSQCGRSFPKDQVVMFEGRAICAACKPMFVQKLREGASLPTELSYGGFWIRFLAKFIDGIILAIVQWAILIPVSMMMAPAVVQSGNQFPTAGYFTLVGVQLVVSILIPATYTTFFIGRFSATLGKMACRLQVVTPEGGKVSYARALGRYFAEIISSLILAIGYIMAAFDDEKRALHDRICSTRVIHKA